MTPRVTAVIPVYNEGDSIVQCLDGLVDAMTDPFEILVVYDTLDDTTRPHVEKYAEQDPRVVPTLMSASSIPGCSVTGAHSTVISAPASTSKQLRMDSKISPIC